MAKIATKKTTKTATKPKTTRTVARAVKAKPSEKSNELKPFSFIGGDTKYVGPEPSWEIQPKKEERFSKLARAFTWYNGYFKQKEAKEMMIHWLTLNKRPNDIKVVKSIPDGEISVTQCWLARMNLMGLELTDHEKSSIENTIESMRVSKRKPVTDIDDEDKKPTIQDRLLEKVKEAASEIDAMYETFIKSGCKMTADIKPINVMRSMNVSPQHTSYISDIWQKDLNEVKLAYSGDDEYVTESYSGYTKIQLRNIIKFIEQVLSDCLSYLQVKKTERKPRAKKAVSPERLAVKIKYLRDVPELKIKSEAPAKIVAAQEAWLYDNAKRKLIYVAADFNAGSLTIKGSSIVGFDASKTVQKTIRKPQEIIGKFTKEGKPALRKLFKEIKSTETKWSGRSNENLVILRVW